MGAGAQTRTPGVEAGEWRGCGRLSRSGKGHRVLTPTPLLNDTQALERVALGAQEPLASE